MTKLPFDPKIVLLTGAGASVPFGMPTAAGFLDVLRKKETIDQQLLEEAIAASQELVAGTQVGGVDVESLLDHLASFSSGAPSFLIETKIYLAAADQQRILERAKKYTRLREQILESIVETYSRVDADKSSPIIHTLTYGLAMCYGVRVLPAFTLNYDLGFETYVDETQPKIEIIDGFDRAPSALIRRWSKDVIPSSLALPPAEGTELRLLLFKLHGSANWGRDSRTRELHQLGFLPRDPGLYETVLYYPSLTQKPTYQEPFQTAFDYFLHSVMAAETIIIIGTSFRDKPVTDILLRAKENCHFVICNLSKDEPSFIRELRERKTEVTYIGGDLGHASTRYAVVRAAVPSPLGQYGAAGWIKSQLGLPVMDSIAQAGLYRIGQPPNAIVEGDIIAGPGVDWFIVSDGKRCHIPDIPTFDALGLMRGGLETISKRVFCEIMVPSHGKGDQHGQAIAPHGDLVGSARRIVATHTTADRTSRPAQSDWA